MELQKKRRFVLSKKVKIFLEELAESAKNKGKTLPKGMHLYRARIGGKNIGEQWQKKPLPLDQMGAPSCEEAAEGRMNPRGIPCLYLASDESTAVAEVRPWVSAPVTVAVHELKKDVSVINLEWGSPEKKVLSRALAGQPLNREESEEVEVWSVINALFLLPTSPHDSYRDYAPTQYLGELFQSIGFGGVWYSSCLNRGGHNVGLFDVEATAVSSCKLMEVYAVNYDYRDITSLPWRAP